MSELPQGKNLKEKKFLKNFKKGIDKAETKWYNRQAVAASDSEKLLENWTTRQTKLRKFFWILKLAEMLRAL